ncbi:hypothetical protein ACCO45_004885 [Purpureocillium lilacinum]|uniref:Uncharacterized protein n=1 Tax=Purpureocillium lilacinum TaxID=33203 RepID=A0ACC4DWW4_PURLI
MNQSVAQQLSRLELWPLATARHCQDANVAASHAEAPVERQCCASSATDRQEELWKAVDHVGPSPRAISFVPEESAPAAPGPAGPSEVSKSLARAEPHSA